MTDRPRRRRGLTLPELVAVAVLIGIAATAVIAFPTIGRDRAYTLEAAATVEAVLATATSVWLEAGRLPHEPPCLDSAGVAPLPCNDDDAQPNPHSLVEHLNRRHPQIELVGSMRDVADETAPSITALSEGQVGDIAAISWIPGDRSAAVGVAARAANGDCLLSRIDLGDRAGPQRFGVVEAADPAQPCQGETALLLPEVHDPDRAGASWANPTRIRSTQ